MRSSKWNLVIAALRGAFWTYSSNYVGKLLTFIATTVLARILTKEDFGLAGYALVTIGFLDVLSDLGIGSALIYHGDNPEASDTSFWLNLLTSSLLYLLTLTIAPYAGKYFNDLRAVPLVKILGLVFPISALRNIHGSLLRRDLHFNKKFIPDIIAYIGKGVTSICLAFLGFGAWSLIWGQVSGHLFSLFAYWIVMPWRPTLRFSWLLAKDLLSYGVGLITVGALGMLLLNIDYLFIGRYLGAVALGIYTLAFRVPELLIKQFCGTLAKVAFPVYTKLKGDPQTLTQAFLGTIRYVTIITIPLGLGLALIAEPFVLVFFSSKWLEAIPVMRIVSIYSLVLSLVFNAGDILKAQGRIKLLTQLSVIRGLILIPALWLTVRHFQSIVAVGWTQTIVAVITSCITIMVIVRIFDTNLLEIMNALRPSLISGIIMAAFVVAVLYLSNSLNSIMQLVLSVSVGCFVYIGTLWWFQRDLFIETNMIVRMALKRGIS